MTCIKDMPADIVEASAKACRVLGVYGNERTAEKLLTNIARAILAERQRDQWQDIATAPKDGTYIMVGNEHGSWVAKYAGHYQSGFKPPNPWMSMMLNHRHMPHLCSNIPTHWMPLPAAPKGGT